jgi:hypothetical protein
LAGPSGHYLVPFGCAQMWVSYRHTHLGVLFPHSVVSGQPRKVQAASEISSQTDLTALKCDSRSKEEAARRRPFNSSLMMLIRRPSVPDLPSGDMP